MVSILCLLNILANRIHTGFDFPELLRILPDGFELGIGFLMLLFQSGILCIQPLAIKLAVRELGGQFAAGFLELFQFGGVVCLVLLFGTGEFDYLQAVIHRLHLVIGSQIVRQLADFLHASGLAVQFRFQRIGRFSDGIDTSLQRVKIMNPVFHMETMCVFEKGNELHVQREYRSPASSC